MAALFERTIVPLDGSKRAETSIDVIAPLVRAQHGEIILVMVLDGHVDRSLSDFAESEGLPVTGAAEAYLDGVAASLTGSGVQCRHRLVFDPDAATAILAVASDEIATSMVVASHGRTGFTRWVLGSVAQKLLHSGDTPTLVIPVRT